MTNPIKRRRRHKKRRRPKNGRTRRPITQGEGRGGEKSFLSTNRFGPKLDFLGPCSSPIACVCRLWGSRAFYPYHRLPRSQGGMTKPFPSLPPFCLPLPSIPPPPPAFPSRQRTHHVFPPHLQLPPPPLLRFFSSSSDLSFLPRTIIHIPETHPTTMEGGRKKKDDDGVGVGGGGDDVGACGKKEGKIGRRRRRGLTFPSSPFSFFFFFHPACPSVGLKVYLPRPPKKGGCGAASSAAVKAAAGRGAREKGILD